MGNDVGTTTSEERAEQQFLHLGVYRELEQVPEEYRLKSYSTLLKDEDTWGEFFEHRVEFSNGISTGRKRVYQRVEDRWKRHTRKENIHHALANPGQVEKFIAVLGETRTIATLFDTYFSPLALFFQWLWYHPEYPHRYSPVLLAVLRGGACERCWTYKLEL